jgi:hypothetical protein
MPTSLVRANSIGKLCGRRDINIRVRLMVYIGAEFLIGRKYVNIVVRKYHRNGMLT